MKKEFFKVRIVQSTGNVILNVPATDNRLFKLVYDCLTSGATIEVLDIHDQELYSKLDNLCYGD